MNGLIVASCVQESFTGDRFLDFWRGSGHFARISVVDCCTDSESAILEKGWRWSPETSLLTTVVLSAGGARELQYVVLFIGVPVVLELLVENRGCSSVSRRSRSPTSLKSCRSPMKSSRS